MKLEQLTEATRDTLSVRRVFGDPYEHDGVAVIPAARVSGGGGGGEGHDPQGQEGEGGGFGAQARASGLYVIRDGKVSWQPAVDVNRLFAVLGAVLITFLVMRERTERARMRFAFLDKRMERHQLRHTAN